jgi:hypothetical protein
MTTKKGKRERKTKEAQKNQTKNVPRGFNFVISGGLREDMA